MKHQNLPTSGDQHGAALIVALIFLAALTLLGIASMGNNTLQVKMAYSAGETSVAFQSAESAITDGEAWIEEQTTQPIPDCVNPCGNTSAIWLGPRDGLIPEVRPANFTLNTWWAAQGRPFGHAALTGSTPAINAGQQYSVAGAPLAITDDRYPRYVIEELGEELGGSKALSGPPVPKLWYYQVTGRGGGALVNGTQTITQSVYTKRF